MFKWECIRSRSNIALRRLSKPFLCWIILCLFSYQVTGQIINVGHLSFEDYYRRSQLAGKTDSTVSFTLRPLTLSSVAEDDSIKTRLGYFIYKSPEQKNNVQILPVVWRQQYHANPTINRNDGSLIPAKGYQTLISAGAFAKYGPLLVQLRPEFFFAENITFDSRRRNYGSMDLPSRFGDNSYSRPGWGQSSIRLEFDPVSIGLSNENLWWGPGIQNSLLMSNSAAGFKHLTLNTSHPVRTPLGSFEAQILAGRLEGSGFNTNLPEDWRYLSGLAFTFQPKWVPGLFFGLTRSFQIYNVDMDGSFADIFPFFQAFQKVKTNEGSKRRDQLTSVFSRLLIPRANAEVYFEYGLNDHSYNTRDFLMTPEHSRAYILGTRKLVPFKQRSDEFIQFSAEITHMEQSIDRTIRDAGEWYTHSELLQGYTNRGEVLGAGIGPGSNLQTINVSWVKGLNQIGVQLERLEHNGDLAHVFGYSPWIDLSVATVADWTYKQFLLSGRLQGIQSVNYQWKDGISGRPKRNVFCLNAEVGIMYSF